MMEIQGILSGFHSFFTNRGIIAAVFFFYVNSLIANTFLIHQPWEDTQYKDAPLPPSPPAELENHTATSLSSRFTNVSLHSVDKDNPHPQVRFPPPTSKWLDDFNMNGTAKNCGALKCVFRSKTNPFNDAKTNAKEYGYVISQAKEKQFARNQRIFWAWEKVESLSDQFSIQHLFIGPPVPFNCSKSFAKLLNQNSEHTHNKSAPIFYHTEPKLLKETQLIVQPIELAPKDSILFGCSANKVALARKKLIQYFKDDSNPPSDLDLLTFDENLESGFRSTENMTGSEEGKCMRRDFQLLIDPLLGTIYQIDIDRCFEKHHSMKGFPSCLNELQRFVADLKRCKRGSCPPDTDGMEQDVENRQKKEKGKKEIE